MSEVIKAIFDVVIWTYVPVVLCTVIVFAYFIADKIESAHYKKTARSGFWAGFMLFVMVLVYQVSIFLKTGFPDAGIYQGFNLFLAVGAALMTFPLFQATKKLSPKAAGWIVLTFVALSFILLFHYLFVHTLNEYILSVVLGVSFGVFAHTAFTPISLEDLIKFS
ncbi:MAG: hypothetical protein AAB915_01760 [Patescibacteria group bacterium]